MTFDDIELLQELVDDLFIEVRSAHQYMETMISDLVNEKFDMSRLDEDLQYFDALDITHCIRAIINLKNTINSQEKPTEQLSVIGTSYPAGDIDVWQHYSTTTKGK